jgi:predicted TIM-barrel fold metal-dependent hydrolase
MRLILDTDQHVTPPKDFWTSRMSAKFADVAPRVIETEDGYEAWSFEGGRDLHAFGLENVGGRDPSTLSWYTRYEDLDVACYDPVARIGAMDVDGVDAALLFASVAGRCAVTQDDELYEASFVAYNNGIREWADAGDPRRMFPAAIIPCRGLDMAMTELERVAGMGFKHFLGIMSPRGVARPGPEDHPFWALAQETGMTVSLHGGGVTGRFPAVPAEGPKKVATPPVRDQITIAAGRSGGMGVQTTLASFVFHGLFEHFPDLKFALIETSCGWFPTFVERLDAAYVAHRDLVADPADVKQLPSEYLSRLRMNFDRETEGFAWRDRIGVDRLMFGTDYPHIGSYWPHSRYYLHLLLRELPSDQVDAILWRNGADLYGIEAPVPAASAAA